MKVLITTSIPFLLNSAVVVDSDKPPPVSIQDVADSIGGVIESTFTSALDSYDPGSLEGLMYADKESLEFNGNCTDFAKVSYKIENLRNLQYFSVESVKAVGRSDRVSATEKSVFYDGFFEVKAGFFLDLETDVSIMVESKGCGMIEESEGVATTSSTEATMILALQGSGPSLDHLSIDAFRLIEMGITFRSLESTVAFDYVVLDSLGDLSHLVDITINQLAVPELTSLAEGQYGKTKA